MLNVLSFPIFLMFVKIYLNQILLLIMMWTRLSLLIVMVVINQILANLNPNYFASIYSKTFLSQVQEQKFCFQGYPQSFIFDCKSVRFQMSKRLNLFAQADRVASFPGLHHMEDHLTCLLQWVHPHHHLHEICCQGTNCAAYNQDTHKFHWYC